MTEQAIMHHEAQQLARMFGASVGVDQRTTQITNRLLTQYVRQFSTAVQNVMITELLAIACEANNKRHDTEKG